MIRDLPEPGIFAALFRLIMTSTYHPCDKWATTRAVLAPLSLRSMMEWQTAFWSWRGSAPAEAAAGAAATGVIGGTELGDDDDDDAPWPVLLAMRSVVFLWRL